MKGGEAIREIQTSDRVLSVQADKTPTVLGKVYRVFDRQTALYAIVTDGIAGYSVSSIRSLNGTVTTAQLDYLQSFRDSVESILDKIDE